MAELPTSEKLALALEAEGAPNWIVEKARQKYYDDYESSHPFPIGQLIKDLSSLRMVNLVERVVNGEFDGTLAESEAWAKSDEGKATFDAFREIRLKETKDE